VTVHVAICVSVLIDVVELDSSILHSVSNTVEVESLYSLRVLGDVECLGELLRDDWVNLVEDSKLSLEDVLVSASAHVSSQIADHSVLSSGLASVDLVPHLSWLNKVDWLKFREVGDGVADVLVVDLVERDGSLEELRRSDGRNEVGSAATVVEGHAAISLEASALVFGHVLIDWELLVVCSDSVSVGVWVREESGLKDWVGRWLDTGYQVSWVESSLLDLGKVVHDVSVELELSELAERIVAVWPDLGQVEDVDLAGLGLLRCHGLDVDLPLGEVSLCDGIEEILGGIVWCATSKLSSLLLSQELGSLLREQVELDIDPFPALLTILKVCPEYPCIFRYPSGIPRSPNSHMTWWMDSGLCER